MPDSIPQPHHPDLQAENTQVVAEQIRAVGRIIEELGRKWEKEQYRKHSEKKQDLKIEIAKGTTHQALYEKYSQGSDPNRPVNTTRQTALVSLKKGHSPAETADILSHDPHVQKVAQTQGTVKAQQHTEQIVRSAWDRREKAQTQNQQRSRQQKRTRARQKGGPNL
ncbi:MAG: hypothetical protein GVY17_00185 [Cyanobacteria bacterium]|jgi:hypothetical protein|nr:hypothetical protein [Cyanobacteria bacterium GSL.Bin21]